MYTFSLCVVHVCTSYDDVVKDLMSLFVLNGKGQRVLICDEGNNYTWFTGSCFNDSDCMQLLATVMCLFQFLRCLY